MAGLVGLVALVLAGRVDRAPGNLLTNLLFALPHLWAAHGGLIFVAWIFFPDRRVFPALLGLSLLGATALWGPGMARWSGESTGPQIRVLSWNVQRLWGTGEAETPGCVRELIERERPDVVALMEVNEANLEALGPGLDCAFTPYSTRGPPGRGGVAVCGREGWTARGKGQRFVADDDWQYLEAEVERDGTVFNLLAVHLPPHHFGASAQWTEKTAARQADQSRALVERIAKLRDPTIVAGDFNSTRDFWLHAALREQLQDTWEYGGLGFGGTKLVGGWLPLRIDFIYASRDFTVLHTRVLPERCSDHRPILTQLSLAR